MPKNFWLYSDKWRDQDIAKGECLVLGGEYTVWKIVNQAIYLQDKYCKYGIPNTVGVDDLVLASKFPRCLLNVGDIVSPSSQFDFDPFKSELKAYYKKYFLDNHNGEFKVVGVLNGRYIFIGYEPFSDYSLPFACNDFNFKKSMGHESMDV